MRKLLVETFLTLDGVMQAPGGPDEDDEGGFGFGGWLAPLWDEDLDRAQLEDTMGRPFDLLLGRRTYDIFAAYWPTAPDESRAKPLNDATKFVVSRSNRSLDWGPSELIGGDAVRAVADLKVTDGPDLQMFGSGNLLQTLIPAGLIDEYRLMTFPVTIGTGKRLFADGTVPAALRLTESSVSKNGVVIAKYEPAGELATGSVS
jgi:dihydrofolate reductase